MGGWIAFILVGFILLLVFSSISHVSWVRRMPDSERFAKQRAASTSLRTQVRRDVNASVTLDDWRYLWRHDSRYWFQGTGCPPVPITAEKYAELEQAHMAGPTLVAASGDRQFWWWNDQFFWDNGQYSADDVRAVILKNERQNRQRVEQARTAMTLERDPSHHRRDAIPEDVRRFVFQRDGGECQKCGSRELLQFDHIIPVALGGSSEPENLQLLCTPCNREKSDTL